MLKEVVTRLFDIGEELYLGFVSRVSRVEGYYDYRVQ